ADCRAELLNNRQSVSLSNPRREVLLGLADLLRARVVLLGLSLFSAEFGVSSMNHTAHRKPITVEVELRCRDESITLSLKYGETDQRFNLLGKTWRTLRRGDIIRGENGYDYRVQRVLLREAEPPLKRPLEVESIAAWASSGLGR